MSFVGRLPAQYVQWVRGHPERAQQIEQTAQSVVYFLMDPQDLVSMEGGYTAVRALQTVNTAAVESPPRSQLLLDILRVLQQLLELVARKRLGSRSAWVVIVVIEVLKTLINTHIHRFRVLKALRQARRALQNFTAFSVTPVRSRGRVSGLRIPRVLRKADDGQEDLDVFDMLTLMLQALYGLRPVLVALAYMRWAGTAGATWRVWRMCFIAELMGVALSQLVYTRATPSVSSEADADGPAVSTVTQSDIETRMKLLAMYSFRNPFFNVVLRDTVQNVFVDGFLAQIPLFGFFIRNTAMYTLAMQRHSYFFTSST